MTWAPVIARIPRSRKSDSVHSLDVVWNPCWVKVRPPTPKSPEVVLVGQVDDVGQVADAGLAHLVLHVEGVLEGGTLAGAGPVPHADHEDLAFALLHLVDRRLEGCRRLGGVARGAHRVGVAVRPESRRGAEVELRAGGVDQVVVVQFAVLAGTGRVGVGELDVGRVGRGSPSGWIAVASACWNPMPLRL